MKIDNIYSSRKNNTEVYSDLIYEWEDVIAESLNIPIRSTGKTFARGMRLFDRICDRAGFSKILQAINKKIKPNSYTLIYHLYPVKSFGFKVFSDKIPYLIDFDKNVDIDKFNQVYANCRLILVSSLNAYNMLKAANCPLNLAHLPLGISDKHRLWTQTNNKKYDVIFVRTNAIMLEYTKKYAFRHPEFNYVIRTWAGNEMYRNNVYVSNKDGILGEFSEREDYLRLLRSSKIAIYSTPGCDEPASKFINHVTPSLFEFVVNGCKIIARYPENEETRDFELSIISPSVNSYEEFEQQISQKIGDRSEQYLTQSSAFLQKVYMSKRIQKLKEILKTS
ncbi:hypothetical protein ABDK00_008280 [Niabella insulamsoli]|uniref:hypothetical protein n=1 Tax=Niabella insulamsoli TaxID=3144874 RepID=UPI0031FDDFC6